MTMADWIAALDDQILRLRKNILEGNGTVSHQEAIEKAECLAIASNADQKKPLVKAAKEYFTEGMTSKELATSVEGNVLIYRSSTGKVNVSVLFSNDTFWLSQKRMSELFNVTIPDITYHLKQLDENGEVHLSEVIKKILIPSEKWDEQGVLLCCKPNNWSDFY